MQGDIMRFETSMQSLETRLRAEIERVETALLTEFHKWAVPVEMRFGAMQR